MADRQADYTGFVGRLAAGETFEPTAGELDALLHWLAGRVNAEAQAIGSAFDFHDLPRQAARRTTMGYLDATLFAHDRDPYRLLGLTPDCELAAVRRRHKQLMQVLHPDRHDDNQAWFTERSERINRAYADLKANHGRAAAPKAASDVKPASAPSRPWPSRPRPAPAFERWRSLLANKDRLRRQLKTHLGNPASLEKRVYIILVAVPVILLVVVFVHRLGTDGPEDSIVVIDARENPGNLSPDTAEYSHPDDREAQRGTSGSRTAVADAQASQESRETMPLTPAMTFPDIVAENAIVAGAFQAFQTGPPREAQSADISEDEPADGPEPGDSSNGRINRQTSDTTPESTTNREAEEGPAKAGPIQDNAILLAAAPDSVDRNEEDAPDQSQPRTDEPAQPDEQVSLEQQHVGDTAEATREARSEAASDQPQAEIYEDTSSERQSADQATEAMRQAPSGDPSEQAQAQMKVEDTPTLQSSADTAEAPSQAQKEASSSRPQAQTNAAASSEPQPADKTTTEASRLSRVESPSDALQARIEEEGTPTSKPADGTAETPQDTEAGASSSEDQPLESQAESEEGPNSEALQADKTSPSPENARNDQSAADPDAQATAAWDTSDSAPQESDITSNPGPSQEPEQAKAPSTKQQDPATSKPGRPEIRAFLNQYQAAYNVADINRFSSLFQKDASSKNASSRSEIARKYQAMFERTRDRHLVLQNVRFEQVNNRQYRVQTHYQVNWTYRDGDQKTDSGQFELLLNIEGEHLKISRLDY